MLRQAWWLKPTSHEILLAHNFFVSCPIFLKFCAEHGSDTAVICTKFQQDWTIETCYGRTSLCLWISYIAQFPSIWPAELGLLSVGMWGIVCISYEICKLKDMMMSSSGNIFRLTDPLWGEATSHLCITLTKTSDAGLRWCFLWSAPEQTVEQTIKMSVIWDAIALIMIWDAIALIMRSL